MKLIRKIGIAQLLCLLSLNAIAASTGPSKDPFPTWASILRSEADLKANYSRTVLQPGFEAGRMRDLPRASELENADQAWSAFHAQYDQYNLAKIDHFLAREEKVLDCLHQTVPDRELLKLETEAREKLAEYRRLKPLFGRLGDHHRINAHRDFYRMLRKIARRAREIEENAPGRSFAARLEVLRQQAILAPNLLKGIWKLITDPHPKPGSRAMVDETLEAIQERGRARGMHVRWEGLENQPADIRDGRTYVVYAFEHPGFDSDWLAFSYMNLDGVTYFGGSPEEVPAPLARLLERSDEFLLVHPDPSKTIEKITRLVREKRIHGSFISFEGWGSAGLYETRPVRDAIGDIFIPELLKAGIDLKIVPISFPDSYRMMEAYVDPVDPDASEIRAIMHPALSAQDMRVIQARTGTFHTIGRWLRQTWHEQRRSDSENFLGMPELPVQRDRLDLYLWGEGPSPLKDRCNAS